MKDAVFVISEFNPFHFGHAHLTAELHKEFDTVVCLMSGAFVQRGTPACADKYSRAKAAVLGGADLVIELPFPYSCLSARDFARAGVRLGVSLGAKAFGFGAENDFEQIKNASSVVTEEAVRAAMERDGRLSYPKAASAVMRENGIESDLLSKPNNILALEYLRAAGEFAPKAGLFAVKRGLSFASSSAIRAQTPENRRSLVPETTYETLKDRSVPENALDTAIMAFWRAGGIKETYGADESTVFRVKNAVMTCSTVEEACEKAASATLTKARVRRTLINGFFGVTPGLALKAPSFALLLASGPKGRAYLSAHKKEFSVPLITKPADYKSAGDEAISDFEFALCAERVYALACKGYNPLSATPFSCT
ncbi:MAG: nucleotidyltransferase family protein [Clostridia bacterium]|nr:nucleotidyltransferase family protein [Clostridia bacterium]